MNLYAKSGLALLGAAAAAALFFILRYQMSLGLLDTIHPVTPGACRDIGEGLNGPEDVEIDAPHNAIFVTTGGASPRKSARDGLYWLKLDDPTARPAKVAGTPDDFHTHGMNLYRAPDGSETVMVVDHKSNRLQQIEIYSLSYDGQTPKLTLQRTVRSPLLTDPNDLAAISPTDFYVTNSSGATGPLSRWAETYLVWPLSNLVLSDGAGLRVAAPGIAYANGVQVSPDGRFVYVDAFDGRKVIAYRRDAATGVLTQIGELALPAKPDNISMDEKGDLVIAGRTKPTAAQVFRVHIGRDGVPQSYDILFSDPCTACAQKSPRTGHNMTRASAGAIYGNHLFIGSSRDDHMLMCDVKS